METGFYAALSLILVTLYLLLGFPGGTIVMAIACRHRQLGGLDWVLSVIVPGYGLCKALLDRRRGRA